VPEISETCGHIGRIVVGPNGRDPQYSCVKPVGHRAAGDEWHEDASGNAWNYDD
jgi:hypothetical protein